MAAMSVPEQAHLIADLFAPHPVEARSASASPDHIAALFGGEASYITPMVGGRRAEYATGRACARVALASLGRTGVTSAATADVAILRDERGAPIWPADTTGSISHTEGFCAAVAARRSSTLDAIGLDIERIDRVGKQVRRRILTDAEADRVHALPEVAAQLATAVAFAAKEAFYKAQYQLTRTYLGFGAVDVVVDDEQLTFLSDHTAVAAFIDRVSGRFAISDGRVVAAAFVAGAAPT